MPEACKSKKKDDIIKNLGGLIPEFQLRFWKNILEVDVPDLINENDPEISNDT